MVAEKRFTSAREQFIVSRSVPRNARVQRLSATDGPFTRLASRSTLLPSPGAARAVGAPNSHRLGALIAYLGRAYAEKLTYGLAAVRLAYSSGDLHPRVCLHPVADVHHCFKIVIGVKPKGHCRSLRFVQAYTCMRCAFPQSNHGRTPETCRRLDAPGSGILGGFQRGPRPTSEKAGRVPGRTSPFRISLFIANPHAIAPKTGVDRCFREPSMKGRAACGT